MLNISTFALLSIWSELEQCYYNDNKFAGDTAEIYVHRCIMHSPTFEHNPIGTFGRETCKQAKETLSNILYHFWRSHKCEIYVDGELLDDWYEKDIIFSHRVHVKIVRK